MHRKDLQHHSSSSNASADAGHKDRLEEEMNGGPEGPMQTFPLQEEVARKESRITPSRTITQSLLSPHLQDEEVIDGSVM